MTTTQLIPTPKARFQESSDNIKKHHDLLENPAFDRAEAAALLEYSRKLAVNLGTTTNPQVDGMVTAWKLNGAREFLAEFRLLAEKTMPVEKPGIDRVLNHDAN